MNLLFFQSPESASSGHTIVEFHVFIPYFDSVVCEKLSEAYSLLDFYCLPVCLFAEYSCSY